jgi:hypothetical protein
MKVRNSVRGAKGAPGLDRCVQEGSAPEGAAGLTRPRGCAGILVGVYLAVSPRLRFAQPA